MVLSFLGSVSDVMSTMDSTIVMRPSFRSRHGLSYEIKLYIYIFMFDYFTIEWEVRCHERQSLPTRCIPNTFLLEISQYMLKTRKSILFCALWCVYIWNWSTMENIIRKCCTAYYSIKLIYIYLMLLKKLGQSLAD